MKYLLTLILLVPTLAMAETDLDVELAQTIDELESRVVASEEVAPKPFDNSEIERTLKDGKIQKFDGDKYMIVRRGQKRKPCPKCEKPEVRKNRISILAGRGPSGDLNRDGRGIYTEHEPIVGLSYQRLGVMYDRLSVGIQIQTNETVLGSAGWEF